MGGGKLCTGFGGNYGTDTTEAFPVQDWVKWSISVFGLLYISQWGLVRRENVSSVCEGMRRVSQEHSVRKIDSVCT